MGLSTTVHRKSKKTLCWGGWDGEDFSRGDLGIVPICPAWGSLFLHLISCCLLEASQLFPPLQVGLNSCARLITFHMPFNLLLFKSSVFSVCLAWTFLANLSFSSFILLMSNPPTNPLLNSFQMLPFSHDCQAQLVGISLTHIYTSVVWQYPSRISDICMPSNPKILLPEI